MASKVSDEMNRNVKTLSPDDTVKTAAERMSKYWMGSIVVTEGAKIVGIITERDVLSKIVATGKDPSKTMIRSIMSQKVITIEETTDLADAIEIMKVNDIKKLPVTDKGKLSGIITTTDIITSMDDNLQKEDIKLESYRDLKVLVRRHAIDLKREIDKNKILTFIIPNALYPTDSLSIIKAASEAVPKCIFVTVNKPYYSLIENLKKNNINTDGFFFIDASEEGEAVSGENFEKIKNPSDITELMLSIEKALQSRKHFGLIFDSVSTLLTYHKEDMISRFAHKLVNKLRKHNVKGIIICTKEDTDTELMKNLNMIADYSVDIEKRGEIS